MFDGDGGGDAFDFVDIWFFQLVEELAGVGGEGLHVFSLTFSEDGVEGEGRFAAAGEAGDDNELVAWDGDIDVFEVVFAGAADADIPRRGRRGGTRHLGLGTRGRSGGCGGWWGHVQRGKG